MTRPTVFDDLPHPFGETMQPPAFENIPTFTEFQQKERESKRNLLFALLAMTLYTSLKITGLVCATLIILQNTPDWQYLAVGAILFLATLAARFEFNPAHKAKKEQPHVTK